MKHLQQITDDFGGRVIGTPFMKLVVAEAVLKLPKKIIHQVTSSIWFLSSAEDAWAYTFKGNDLKNRHLIFLSDELLAEPKNQIFYTILHEIGHVVLKHQNSIGFKQTQSEIDTQEREADQFAQKFL